MLILPFVFGGSAESSPALLLDRHPDDAAVLNNAVGAAVAGPVPNAVGAAVAGPGGERGAAGSAVTSPGAVLSIASGAVMA